MNNSTSLADRLSQINTVELSKDIRDRSILQDLNFHLQELNLALDKYNQLFNYTKYYGNKLNLTRKQIEKLSSEGVSVNNERLVKLKNNMKKSYTNWNIQKTIFNSPDISAKEAAINSLITVLDNLVKSLNNINKDIIKLNKDKIFKSGFFGKKSEVKQQELIDQLIAISTSINTEKSKFVKLKTALKDAQSAQAGSETAAKLEAKLAKLRGNFNAARNKMPIKELSTPQQREGLTKAIRNIDKKISISVRGGATRKRRHSRRRHTRRN